MTITINKRVIYFVLVAILGVLIIGYYQGLFVFRSAPVPIATDSLVMTSEEARLTKQAINLVRGEVADGKLPTTVLTIRALFAELPEAVRDQVLRALGNPGMDEMQNALNILDRKIIVRN